MPEKGASIVALQHDAGLLPEIHIHLFVGQVFVVCHGFGDEVHDGVASLPQVPNTCTTMGTKFRPCSRHATSYFEHFALDS